ncbi:MAG: GNAT family N-acetyltransferase [Rhodocyclaceae bacterium]|nr:GNAT family N-acetyltransferase [Rhodocyclaceae bacterium]
MKIRRFGIGDELALHRVFFSAIHDIAVHDYTPEQIDAWAPANIDAEKWADRMRGINPFVAEMDGEIVGYADVQSSGLIDHFFVSGAHPRRGVGRMLMAAIHMEAERLHLTELVSEVSRTAQGFFAHFGFHIVAQQSKVIRGVVVPNARMQKVLSRY